VQGGYDIEKVLELKQVGLVLGHEDVELDLVDRGFAFF
jgi:hypothetical protein